MNAWSEDFILTVDLFTRWQ